MNRSSWQCFSLVLCLVVFPSCIDETTIEASNIFDWKLCTEANVGDTLANASCSAIADGQSQVTVEVCLDPELKDHLKTIPVELRLSAGAWVTGASSSTPSVYTGDLGRGGCLRPAFRTTTSLVPIRVDAKVLEYSDTKNLALSPMAIKMVTAASSPAKLALDESTELNLTVNVRGEPGAKPTEGTTVAFSATIQPAGKAFSFQPALVDVLGTTATTKLWVAAGATSIEVIARASPPVSGDEVSSAPLIIEAAP